MFVIFKPNGATEQPFCQEFDWSDFLSESSESKVRFSNDTRRSEKYNSR